jgi:hypothetical protein
MPPQREEQRDEVPKPLQSPSLKRPLAPKSHTSPPAKKQTKWTPNEDAIIIDLRGKNEKWEDISEKLPGRSAISCRLRYQNYLERRSEWDEEKKNKLARLYERYVQSHKLRANIGIPAVVVVVQVLWLGILPSPPKLP